MKYVFNSNKSIVREISNYTLILNMESGEMYSIRGIAVSILKFLKEPKELVEIVSHVIGLFDNESIELIETKVKIFIKNLLEKDFIVLV